MRHGSKTEKNPKECETHIFVYFKLQHALIISVYKNELYLFDFDTKTYAYIIFDAAK